MITVTYGLLSKGCTVIRITSEWKTDDNVLFLQYNKTFIPSSHKPIFSIELKFCPSIESGETIVVKVNMKKDLQNAK